MRAWNRAGGLLATGAVLAFSGGCGELLSEEFLVALGLDRGATDVPGEAPSIVLGVENQTNRPVEFLLSWRDSEDDVQSRLTESIPAGDSYLFSLFCAVPEVTLGDVSDLQAIGAAVRLGDGGSSDAFVEVEPFGILLQETINYNCGDRIVFSVRPSGDTLSGYRTFVQIERSGVTIATETGSDGTDGSDDTDGAGG